MRKNDWEMITHFNKNENWGDAHKMSLTLVYTLDRLRQYIGKPIVIHCGYELRDFGGQHPLGNAVDCHCIGMDLIEFFIAASRFTEFKGIGIYPNWENPGLHLDVRAELKRAQWGCEATKKYVPLNKEFLMKLINKKK